MNTFSANVNGFRAGPYDQPLARNTASMLTLDHGAVLRSYVPAKRKRA